MIVKPWRYGVQKDWKVVKREIFAAFEQFEAQETVDELLIHPQDAITFCDDFRRESGYSEMPDDIILRGLIQRRKESHRDR